MEGWFASEIQESRRMDKLSDVQTIQASTLRFLVSSPSLCRLANDGDRVITVQRARARV